MTSISGNTSDGRISVVVPSYNHESFIEQCLLSIIRQTVVPKELIVIDDGSNDGSRAIIERVLKNCPFPCEFYARENRGLCNTLNEGLDKTTGDLFAYLSSDDIWLPRFLESRSQVLDASPSSAPLVYGHSYAIDSESNVIGHSYGRDLKRSESTREMLLFSFVPSSPSILYRKRYLEHERWNPAIKLEDFDLYLRLCVLGEFAFDENVLSGWRTHETNTSKQVELMVKECIGAVERNAETLKLTDDELAAYSRSMKTNLVDTLLEDGERTEAIRMFYQTIDGFLTKGEFLKRAVKLVSPRSVIKKRRQLSRKYFKRRKRIGFIDENFNFVKT
jgi:alpha-1,3-rhamnosyltransferase